MRLSVVVTIVDGGETLERCLAALERQDGRGDFDVIIPWDDSVTGIASLSPRFPSFRFLSIGAVQTARPLRSAAGQHELFDRRRAAGLRAATGEVVAMLEDRGVPRHDWARTMVALHERLPYAAIGGAIENGRSSIRHWAVYLCDFYRFQLPFEAGPRSYVSDINVGYKRRAVEATAGLWRERFHETTVHWSLQAAGETLYLSPEIVVEQCRGPLRIGDLIRERLAWGRLFAYTRARELPHYQRLGLALLTPLLPAIVMVRHARAQLATGVSMRRFLLASPLIAVLSAMWSVGEMLGYLTVEP